MFNKIKSVYEISERSDVRKGVNCPSLDPNKQTTQAK